MSFQPGNKLGKGRPEGSRNKATLAAQELLDGEGAKITRQCIKEALDPLASAHSIALKLAMERIIPAKKIIEGGLNINFNLNQIKEILEEFDPTGN